MVDAKQDIAKDNSISTVDCKVQILCTDFIQNREKSGELEQMM